MPTGVTLGKNGNLYGTTYLGGTNLCFNSGFTGEYGCGTVFELSPTSGAAWTKTVLHDFSGPDGASPDATLVFGSNGVLYGTTQAGGSDNDGGTVFEMAPPAAPGGTWTETVLYSFNGVWNSAHTPFGGVIIGPGGALYGTTFTNWCSGCGPDAGGNETGGTVFTLIPPSSLGGNWTHHTIYNFWPPSDVGVSPFAGLVFSGGSLYGATDFCGNAYQFAPPAAAGGAWAATAIHTFGQSGDGCSPEAPLAVGPGGALYGTTTVGGSSGDCTQAGTGGCGVVFQLTPPATPGGTWTYNVIYSFTGANGDAALPGGGRLLVDGNGVLYGTTECGGTGPMAPTACAFNASERLRYGLLSDAASRARQHMDRKDSAQLHRRSRRSRSRGWPNSRTGRHPLWHHIGRR